MPPGPRRAPLSSPSREGLSPSVLVLHAEARVPSCCPRLFKGPSSKEHWAWGARGRVPVGLTVIKNKSHVGGLTHFPDWPGALVGTGWKEKGTAPGLSRLGTVPSPGLAYTQPPPSCPGGLSVPGRGLKASVS